MAKANSLYDHDFAAWVVQTVAQLRSGDYGAVDWENLIEEIEEMGKRERRALKSNLVVLLLHLLKWQYQPEMRCGSWRGSIVEHRQRLRDGLRESPSLQSYLQEVWAEAYRDGRERAIAETELEATRFPIEPPYTIEQALDADFLPV
ncbi:MAG: hypothetical protein B0A82_02655 [Alkalinema sp. CACIAM 70d]|nr:MAG: hypothetical protein B0A82_02655 [Alkalinema sp. CACIAM 70d]